MKQRVLTFFCMLLLLVECAPVKEKIPPAENMNSKPTGKMVVYQIMARLFGNKVKTNKPYGTLQENGVGKLNDITPAALKSIHELGATHVWYTGVIEHAVLTDYSAFNIALDDADVVKGRAGSPYAIKDYYDINPDLAVNVPTRMAEFEALVNRTHAEGLGVIIDFVPNHVARAYKSDAKPHGVIDLGEQDDKNLAFSSKNNFYYLPGQAFQVPKQYQAQGVNPFQNKEGTYSENPAKATGNNVFSAAPGINDWFETVKLNYGVDYQNNHAHAFDPIPDTWVKMKDILVFWAGKNVDGFRCDMAEMVPVEFWHWVVPQVKAINPNIIFIAEIYNPDQYRNYIQKGQFDFLYDKVQLYDTLRMLVQNQKASTTDVVNIRAWLTDISDHMLHFLENHDEQRLASKFFAGDPWKGVPAMVVSTLIDKGPVLVYFGQEVGEPGAGAEGFSAEDGRTTIFDYWGVPEHQKWVNEGKYDGGQLSAEQKQLRQFYADLLSLAHNPAISEGAYMDLTAFNQQAGNFDGQVHAFLRYKDTEKLIVITSFNDKPQQARIQLSPEAIAALGLSAPEIFVARDLIWREVEVGFDKDFAFTLELKPYTALVLKIK
jgi:glycosidase